MTHQHNWTTRFVPRGDHTVIHGMLCDCGATLMQAEVEARLNAPNPVQELMDKVVNFDCKPGVFKVELIRASYQTGSIAYASFRHDTKEVAGIEAHSDSAEEALKTLLDVMERSLGRCPVCGQYKYSDNVK